MTKSINPIFDTQMVFVPGDGCLDIEVKTGYGPSLILKRDKALGEDIIFKCYEKGTNLFRGFAARNIKYGFFGNVCDDAKKAIESVNSAWFEYMGIRQTQKQK